MSTQGANMKKRFKNVRIVVADYDQQLRSLVRQVLETFGFQDIKVVKNGQEAREIIDSNGTDLLISEWVMEPMGGVELLEYIRLSADSPCRDLPVIFLTGKAEEHEVIYARNKGVTEFVVKPFTAQTLSHRLTQVIDNPRSFIMSKSFVGPDRRRGKEDESKKNNRASKEEMAKYAKFMGDKVVYDMPTGRVVVANPNEDIKKIIGQDVSAEFILDDELVKAAQDKIHEMADEFLQWVHDDLQLLEDGYEALKASPNDKAVVAQVAETALKIKSQSGMFGYDLATEVAKSLYNFLASLPDVNDLILLVIRKHIDLLYVIFHQEITGNGDKIGKEAIEMLNTLISKAVG